MMKHYLAVFAASIFLLLPVAAAGVSHTGSYKVPLTPAFPGDLAVGCGVEDSTTDACSGSGADLESPYTFERGTLQIQANGRVGLKLDDIQVRKGETCGENHDCFCAGHTQDDCETAADCDGGSTGPCVPGGAEETQIKVEIWAQGFYAMDWFWLPDPCGDGSNDDCVRRSELPGLSPACHKEFIFDLTDQDGDINKLLSSRFDCHTGGAPGTGSIRRIELFIDMNIHPEGGGQVPDWQLFARPSWDHDVNLNFED